MAPWKDPAIIIAFVGLLGIVVAQMVSLWQARRTAAIRKQEVDISMVTVNVAFLQSEYKRLMQEVQDIRVELEAARKRGRIIDEKYSVALSYSASLRVLIKLYFNQLDHVGTTHPELPPVHPLIEEDMYHAWPEAFDEAPEQSK